MRAEKIDCSGPQKYISNRLGWYREHYEGAVVTLLKGRYKGRCAVINGITADDHHGFIFCCYVIDRRSETKTVFTSKDYLSFAEKTRQYYPSGEFIVIRKKEKRHG